MASDISHLANGSKPNKQRPEDAIDYQVNVNANNTANPFATYVEDQSPSLELVVFETKQNFVTQKPIAQQSIAQQSIAQETSTQEPVAHQQVAASPVPKVYNAARVHKNNTILVLAYQPDIRADFLVSNVRMLLDDSQVKAAKKIALGTTINTKRSLTHGETCWSLRRTKFQFATS